MNSQHGSKRYSIRAALRERVETFDASVDGADSFLQGPLTMVSRSAPPCRLQQHRAALFDSQRVGGGRDPPNEVSPEGNCCNAGTGKTL